MGIPRAECAALAGANLVPHFTTATPRPKKPTQKDRFRKHANKLRCKCTRVKTARRRRIPTTQPPPRAIVRAKCASVDDTDTAQRGLKKICRDGRRWAAACREEEWSSRSIQPPCCWRRRRRLRRQRLQLAATAAEDPTQLRAQRRYGEVVNSPVLPTEERTQRTTNERKIFKFNITKFMHAET